MITVKRIDQSNPLYAQAIDLRERVLLRPIGYDHPRYLAEFPGIEDTFEHYVAVLDHPTGERVIGNACLLPNTPSEGIGKLSQMAVDPQRQSEGVGTKLVVEIERRATTVLGLKSLMCHAQLRAIPFYERLGWSKEGDLFQEAGIDHYVMCYQLPQPPQDM